MSQALPILLFTHINRDEVHILIPSGETDSLRTTLVRLLTHPLQSLFHVLSEPRPSPPPNKYQFIGHSFIFYDYEPVTTTSVNLISFFQTGEDLMGWVELNLVHWTTGLGLDIWERNAKLIRSQVGELNLLSLFRFYSVFVCGLLYYWTIVSVQLGHYRTKLLKVYDQFLTRFSFYYPALFPQ